MTIRLYINARFLTRPPTGVERYAMELVKALDTLIDRGEIDRASWTFELLAPSRGLRYEIPLRHIPLRKVGRLRGHPWEQLELPAYARGRPLLSPCNVGPVAKRDHVVTIHDASTFATPAAYSRAFRTWYRTLLPALGRTARAVITDSSFSKAELTRFCRLTERKVHPVLLGCEHVLSVEPDGGVLARHGIGERPFVLAVSSLNPNKNLRGLVRTAEILGRADCDVVFAGGANPRVFGSAADGVGGTIKHVGYVTDSELRALYEHAACFIYPSLYEGFGLPALEALACGCPVVASDAASLPEVCGDAALYCNPHDPEDMADKIQRVLTDAGLREELRRRGLERVRRFTWERCARETLDVVRRALTG